MLILYIFFDFSGDLKFIPQSSSYFTLASLCTWDPSDFAAAYHSLKHELVTQDVASDWDYHRFHASEDPVWVRNAFMDFIAKQPDIRADAITVRKNRIFKEYQPPHIFYPHMANLLVKFVLPQVTEERPPDRIEFVIDQFPLKGLSRETFLIKMDSQLGRLCGDTPHKTRFHYSHAHPHLQAVDYCAWAVFRSYERRDYTTRRPLNLLIKSDWEYATRTSHTIY